MGIHGLLEILKPITRKIHVSEFESLSVGVDGHCWIHKAINQISQSYNNKKTDSLSQYISDMVNLLRKNKINEILVVFDGMPLPMKEETNRMRDEQRKKNFLISKSYYEEGDMTNYRKYRNRSTKIGDSLLSIAISILIELKVKYIIAPYEADAQLAYLYRERYIDLVITEDSDLIAYGCDQILFKLNRSGYGEYITIQGLLELDNYDFRGWEKDQFLLFCCLSGCDYFSGIKQIGIKKSYSIVSKYRNIFNVVKHLENNRIGQENNFQLFQCTVFELEKAILTFKCQTIFNPALEKLELLTCLPQYSMDAFDGSIKHFNLEDISFLGAFFSNLIAKKLFHGELFPEFVFELLSGKNPSNLEQSLEENIFNGVEKMLNHNNQEIENVFEIVDNSLYDRIGRNQINNKTPESKKVKFDRRLDQLINFDSPLISKNFNKIMISRSPRISTLDFVKDVSLINDKYLNISDNKIENESNQYESSSISSCSNHLHISFSNVDRDQFKQGYIKSIFPGLL